ncbi:hypothetical protein ACFX1Z_019251 [Malus domestica]
MEIQGVLDYFGTMKLILVSSHPPHTISMWKSVRLATNITGDSLGFMGPQLLVAEALSGLCYVDLPMPVPCHGCVQVISMKYYRYLKKKGVLLDQWDK